MDKKPIIIDTQDSTEIHFPAANLVRVGQPRDISGLASRLANQFLLQNKGILWNYDISASQTYDGSDVWIALRSGIKIGAFPLISPTSGKPEYGMIIRPRFDWSGIGSMLAKMGWRVVPTLLRLPLLPGTERKIPPWVLSSVILVRIHAILDHLERRFELIQTDQMAPKGTVDWTDYAIRKIPKGGFLEIKCTFPDLRDDRSLIGAIHYTLRRQLSGLESQRNLAGAVLFLIDYAQFLLRRVSRVPPKKPTPESIQNWFMRPLQTQLFRDGIQAIEWTVDDRGLAGIADIQGLPWILPMDSFFEAWIETLLEKLVKTIGGKLTIGRKRETISPIHWDRSYEGSQKYLMPDAIIEKENATYIVDAKYKRHWEELKSSSWSSMSDDVQEQHRQDLFQVLAYASTKSTDNVTVCLIYPCNLDTWESLGSRSQRYRHAVIPADGRNINVVLTATPMNGSIDESVANLVNAFSAV